MAVNPISQAEASGTGRRRQCSSVRNGADCETKLLDHADRPSQQWQYRQNPEHGRGCALDRQGTGNLRRRTVEGQHAVTIKMQHGANQADKSAAFRFAPSRLAFATPSAISAIETADRKRYCECKSIHSMSSGRPAAVAGAAAEITLISTR
jgi:hypothetical protein